jgi:hypothetical protein
VNSEGLAKQAYRVQATTSSSSECLLINWDSAQVAGTNDAKGSVTLGRKDIEYALTPTNAYKLEVINQGLQISSSACNQKCSDTYGTDYIVGYGGGIFTCDCIKQTKIGTLLTPDSSGRPKWSAYVSLDGIGTATLTDEVPYANIGSRAYIQYNGARLNRFTFPNPTGWKILTNDAGAVSFTQVSVPSAKVKALDCTSSNYKTCVANYNDIITSASVNELYAADGFLATNSHVSSAKVMNNVLTLTTTESPIWVDLIMDLDAAWVGILKNCGEPSISCPSTQVSAYQTQRASFQVRLTNNGESQGSFAIQTNCPAISGLPSATPISPSSNTLVSLGMQASGVQSGTCSFTAYDVGCPERTDSCNINYDVKATIPSLCGDGKCEGVETSSNCQTDCGTTPKLCGNGVCDSGETSLTCSNDCPPVNDNKILIGMIAILIIVGSFVLTRTQLGKDIIDSVKRLFK